LIHRWKREQKEFSHNSFPSHVKVKRTDEQREIAELKKAFREAKMETEILKKEDDLNNYTQAQLNEIHHVINSHPRKKHNYNTLKSLLYNFINGNFAFAS
jgi:DNA-binding transcriptional regulator GbsR (MarR family)